MRETIADYNSVALEVTKSSQMNTLCTYAVHFSLF